MKNSEIRELNTKELEERIDNERSYLAKLRLNHAITPLDNPHKIMHTRRTIARLKTELNKRKREEVKNNS
ncbi:MAG TPA: 50S ribosomal protein L29 [Bacteroidetes bacterium]|nr:50S ribosomal protein L29 [Bacteroidota bacterium]